jgi:putative ABC transport system permease protein
VLASVGVYAMFASVTASREREFGVRIALGSHPTEIGTLVLRQAAGWMVIGLAAGAVGVVGIGRGVSGLLYGVTPFDPLTLAAAAGILVACATIAMLIPVRRAVGVDPAAVLRV